MNEEGDWLAERILKTDKELSQAFNFDSEYPQPTFAQYI
jgi:hypothetical protein